MPGVAFNFKRPPGMSKLQWVKLASMAMQTVKSVTPVRTGQLRDGWEPVAVTQRSLTLRNDVPYA